MATFVANTGIAPTGTQTRDIVRDGSGNIILGVHSGTATAANVTPHISTDDGQTWTAGDTSFMADSLNVFGWAIDSTGVIHQTARGEDGDSLGNDLYHNSFSIDSTGAVTSVTTTETIVSSANGVGDSAIATTSTDVPWAATQYVHKEKGNTYQYIGLFERSGAGTWTDHGLVAGAQSNWSKPTICVDSTDTIHIAYLDSANTIRYSQFDAGVFTVTRETVGASNGDLAPIIVDTDDVPVIVSDTGAIWKRTSGTWSSQSYTNHTPGWPTSAIEAGDLFAIYDDSGTGDIYENHATFGAFDPAAYAAVETSVNDLEYASARWQQHHNPSGLIDIAYRDTTAGEIYHTAIGEVPTAEAPTLQTTATAALSETTGSVTESGTLTSDATAALTETVTQPTAGLTWETTADWDSAVSESSIHHEQPTGTDWAPSDTIQLGYTSDLASYSATPLAYYPLEEDSGTVANDITGLGTDGTYAGPVLNDPGILGYSAPTFDGVDDYIDTGSEYTSATDAMAISAWIRKDTWATSYESIVNNWDGTNGGARIQRDAANNRLIFGIEETYAYGGTDIADGAWHHVHGQGVSGGDYSIWIDGVNDGGGSTTTAQDTAVSTAPHWIGAQPASGGENYWGGQIAGVIIWDGTLTSTEIGTLADPTAGSLVTAEQRS